MLTDISNNNEPFNFSESMQPNPTFSSILFPNFEENLIPTPYSNLFEHLM